MTDAFLELKIQELQIIVINWAKQKDIWRDAAFKNYIDYYDDEPSDVLAEVCVLACDGTLLGMFDGWYPDLLAELEELLNKTEFYYELLDRFPIFYCREENELNRAFIEYFEWKWICKLIEPEFTSLYDEVYAYFLTDRRRLYDLHFRKFEILILEIFKNQGYHTLLGPGHSDGGVDLRLFQKEGIDQITTLVQIKRYQEKTPIRLDAVAALFGHIHDQKADKGLFVTTSRYLPGVQKFAARNSATLKLAESADILQWSESVRTKIVRDKSKVLTDNFILSLLNKTNGKGLVGKFVVASIGFNMILNDFCLVLIDEPRVALLMRVPIEREYSDPPYNSRGGEIPCQNEKILGNKNRDNVFRAKKTTDSSGIIQFYGQLNAYYLWDGRPRHFDTND